jgi:hypothetical protein
MKLNKIIEKVFGVLQDLFLLLKMGITPAFASIDAHNLPLLLVSIIRVLHLTNHIRSIHKSTIENNMHTETKHASIC